MVTKNEGGWEGNCNSASVWHCGDRGLFAIWTCCFPVKNLFPFPLATALLIGDVMMIRQSVAKVFLSVITAPIVLAHLIDFLIMRCYVTPKCSNIHPANLFHHAYSTVLWNHNYFLRFRFRFLLLKSYGSGSTLEKVMVPVPVPVTTFEKFRFRFQLHI